MAQAAIPPFLPAPGSRDYRRFSRSKNFARTFATFGATTAAQ
jgi:hypothetical protein